MINKPDAHKEEYERTMRADLSHPVDIIENKDKRLILDELHRLMKASLQGMATVQVRRIPRSRIAEILED